MLTTASLYHSRARNKQITSDRESKDNCAEESFTVSLFSYKLFN